METKEEIITLTIKDYPFSRKIKSDWWVWFIAAIFITIGLGLSVIFSVLLANSYFDNTKLAAFSGAIASGLTLSLAGLTQILVFIHRKQDERAKRLEKAEHDYTNFFIKNYHWNEMISLLLSHVNRELGISLVFDGKEKKVKIIFDSSVKSFAELRKKYISSLSSIIYKNNMFVGMLNDKYKFVTENASNYDKFASAFSSFDTEIKKSAMSVEKILQAKYNFKYEDKFYDYNMKDRIINYMYTIMPYFIIIIHDNKNYNFAIKAVELLPFMVYYLCNEEKNGSKQDKQK